MKITKQGQSIDTGIVEDKKPKTDRTKTDEKSTKGTGHSGADTLEIRKANRSQRAQRAFKVAHLNDFHSHHAGKVSEDGTQIGGIARHATLIKQLRNEDDNVLVMCAGDIFDGTVFFNFYKGELDVRLMNAIGFDAMVIGNHETMAGVGALTKALAKANFEVVTANLDTVSQPKLSEMVNTSYFVKELGGFKVGIFGLTTPDTVDPTNPGQSIAKKDLVGIGQKVVDQMTEDGIDIVLCLSHCGNDVDTEIATQLSGVDVIIGGHTHTKVTEAEFLEDKDGNPVLVGQAGSHGEFLGLMNLAFDDNGHLDKNATSLRLQKVDDLIPEDPEIKKLVDEASAPIEEMMATTVLGKGPDFRGDKQRFRSREHPATNLLADALYAHCHQSGHDVDFALNNAGMAVKGLDEGEWKMKDLFSAFPYDAPVGVVNMTGDQIRQGLEHGISMFDESFMGKLDGTFMTGSHLRYHFDMDAAPGSRITAIEVQNKDGEWSAMDPDASYKFAAPGFVMRGGCGCPFGDYCDLEGADLQWMSTPLRDMFAEYVDADKAYDAVRPDREARVTDGPTYDRWLKKYDEKFPLPGKLAHIRSSHQEPAIDPKALRAKIRKEG